VRPARQSIEAPTRGEAVLAKAMLAVARAQAKGQKTNAKKQRNAVQLLPMIIVNALRQTRKNVTDSIDAVPTL
jgi:hypothetical protein